MKKKVLFFLFALSGGGAERTVVNVMNNLNKDKFEVVLVLGTNKNNDYINFISDQVKIITLNRSKLRYSLFKLRKCILKERPDILFSTINSNNIVLLLAKLLTFRKIPTIVREASNRTQSGAVTKINKIITFCLYNILANKIIALSNGVKIDLVDNFKIKKSKIKIIYNPVELEKIIEMSNRTIQNLPVQNTEKLIIAVGRLVEAKDYPTLLKAFKIVSNKLNSRLIILGKGPLEEHLKTLSKSLNISDRVNFLGFKSNPYKYMKRADVFVLSSKWEGFSHVIVEAMATGTPVISTNCNSGPREILEDKYGILVPVENPRELSDRLCELLENKELMNNYSKLGLERAKYYNASRITRQYEEVFMSMM